MPPVAHRQRTARIGISGSVLLFDDFFSLIELLWLLAGRVHLLGHQFQPLPAAWRKRGKKSKWAASSQKHLYRIYISFSFSGTRRMEDYFKALGLLSCIPFYWIFTFWYQANPIYTIQQLFETFYSRGQTTVLYSTIQSQSLWKNIAPA